MPRKQPKLAEVFSMVRDFIAKYAVIPTDADLDILAVWAVGTWTFGGSSPAMPFSYPYLYLTGAKGSGKTHIGNNVFSCFCRNHKPTAMMTGPTLFRMMGTYDEESGEIVAHYPTMFIDEIDAVYSGGADENLRGVCNLGYKRGNTIPRSAGKGTIEFPVYCPKIFGGIDNGHLPDTVADRCIRIDIRQATEDEMRSLAELYDYEVEDESAEMAQKLSDWARDNAMVLRDYRPERSSGISPRQWEISRSLVQIAHALGIEPRIRAAIAEVMNREPERGKRALYGSIRRQFAATGLDRLTTRQLLAGLLADGVNVPGNSGKGLSTVLKGDDIAPRMLRLPDGHPGIVDGQPVQRGYFRFMFDDEFTALDDEEN